MALLLRLTKGLVRRATMAEKGISNQMNQQGEANDILVRPTAMPGENVVEKIISVT